MSDPARPWTDRGLVFTRPRAILRVVQRADHVQPGGQRVASVLLSDGRVLRVVGGVPGEPVGNPMLLWLRWASLA